MRLTFPDDGEEDRFVAGGAASGATPTEAARLTFTVTGYAETRRPEASANAPPSTPRPRQIELGAASSRGPPPAAAGLGHKAGMFRLASHTGLVPRVGALRFYERYGFVVDPDGFCKDHYLIEGVLHDDLRFARPLSAGTKSSRRAVQAFRVPCCADFDDVAGFTVAVQPNVARA